MFKKGQTVWCLIYGQGVVTEVDEDRIEDTYSVLVKFQYNDDHFNISYTTDGRYCLESNVTLFPYPVKIVPDIAKEKPSINWEHVNKKFKWLSVDENGDAYVFENKPKVDDHYWFSLKGGLSEVSGLASYAPGTCDWQDSLVKRPN